MSEPDQYGRYYWCIRIREKEDVYAHADSVNLVNGSLLLLRDKLDTESGKTQTQVNLAFAPGHWEYIYAASVIDGGAVAIQHWIQDGKPLGDIGFSGAK